MPLVEGSTPHDPPNSPVFIVDQSREGSHLVPFDQVMLLAEILSDGNNQKSYHFNRPIKGVNDIA